MVHSRGHEGADRWAGARTLDHRPELCGEALLRPVEAFCARAPGGSVPGRPPGESPPSERGRLQESTSRVAGSSVAACSRVASELEAMMHTTPCFLHAVLFVCVLFFVFLTEPLSCAGTTRGRLCHGSSLEIGFIPGLRLGRRLSRNENNSGCKVRSSFRPSPSLSPP